MGIAQGHYPDRGTWKFNASLKIVNDCQRFRGPGNFTADQNKDKGQNKEKYAIFVFRGLRISTLVHIFTSLTTILSTTCGYFCDQLCLLSL
jgi:hypothetical protein